MPSLPMAARAVVSFAIRLCSNSLPCSEFLVCGEAGFMARTPGSLSAATRSPGSVSAATRNAGSLTLNARSPGSLTLTVR